PPYPVTRWGDTAATSTSIGMCNVSCVGKVKGVGSAVSMHFLVRNRSFFAWTTPFRRFAGCGKGPERKWGICFEIHGGWCRHRRFGRGIISMTQIREQSLKQTFLLVVASLFMNFLPGILTAQSGGSFSLVDNASQRAI